MMSPGDKPRVQRIEEFAAELGFVVLRRAVGILGALEALGQFTDFGGDGHFVELTTERRRVATNSPSRGPPGSACHLSPLRKIFARVFDEIEMEINRLSLDDPRYPAGLKVCLGNAAPQTITAAGDLSVLRPETFALFCSVKCPGNLILQTYDLAQKLRAAGVTVIGGFHSPMERQCLQILLRSPHPVIVCPSRGAPKRVPPEFRRPLEEGRML